MRLEHKTALITGGNSGIGLAAARLFIAEGASVTITGRNRATLDAAAAELGPKALAIEADATEPAAMAKAVEAAAAKFGPIDILFANAGIGGATPVASTPLERFETLLRINLTGAFLTVQAALPHLRRGASVILTGSVHAVLGVPNMSAYAASKAGLRSMTRVLAAELAPQGIRVNIVVPGATHTPIWFRDASAPDMKAVEARVARSVPLGRLSDAEEIAKAVLYLASDDAANVTATELVVDGGHTGSPGGAPVYR